ncbi:MAG: type VI secretion system Vgr family protein, partial [Burkholderiaceae bacterium]|nr:type VI secretion system Vgr family protein [Burkholderiaceae bacterium]
MTPVEAYDHLRRLSQTKRLLRLTFPYDDAPQTSQHSELVINRLEAQEGLGLDFQYTLELLSDNAHLALKDFMGKMLCVELVRADGSLRYFNGLCFEFSLVKSDDGIAYYQAVLRPWLHYLRLRQNNRVFRDQNLHALSETLFAEYGAEAQWHWRVHSTDANFTMAIQFDETDHNFLYRRWEEAGYST